MKPSDFIAKIAPAAVADRKESRVPASLTIAQAILESNWGESGLTKTGNNLFGIKGKGGLYQTSEYVNGRRVTVEAEFRHYPSWADSIKDHSRLLNQRRYANVLGQPYMIACHAVQQAGYATDPVYANKLIGLIEMYGLNRFDEGDEDEMDKVNAVIFGKATSAYLIDNETYVKVADLKTTLPVSWDNGTKTVTIGNAK